MDEAYQHVNVGGAGVDPISIELFSETRLNEDIKASLSAQITSKLPKAHGNRILIIGGRVGITTELLLPYSSRIDVVTEQAFIPVLEALLKKKQTVCYTFYKEGKIGQNLSVAPFNVGHCQINLVQIGAFHDTVSNHNSYDVVLLQNVLVHPKINILHELMRLDHSVLITMIIPGKILHKGLFELLSGIEENILHVFYEQEAHERLEYARHITGREKEINFWEIFVWKKKSLPESGKELRLIEEILQELVDKNIIGEEVDQKKIGIYESPELLARYEDFHFGENEHFGIKNFPHRCAELVIAEARKRNIKGRVLELGCALGRSTLDFAEYFDEAIGLDFSQKFIEVANNNLNSRFAHLAPKVKFVQGDACKLNPDLGKFDVIFASCVIDRLYDPQAFISSLPQFMAEKSFLVIASSYSWLESFTPEDKWLGGKVVDGKEVSSYAGLKEALQLVGLKEAREGEELQFVKQENPWVYQLSGAQLTFWSWE